MKRKISSYTPKMKIAKFVLRIPDRYSLALDGLVQNGVAKSKNELILTVIGMFLSDLRAKAETELHSAVIPQ